MKKLNLPTRFDTKLARDGRAVPAHDELGQSWGTFTIGLADPTLPRYQAASATINRKYAALDAKEREAVDDIVIAAELFVEVSLLGWKDVPDWEAEPGSDGEPKAYTPENAVKFFSLVEVDEATGEKTYPTRWLLDRLSRLAEDVLFFQPDDQKGVPEKN